MFNIVIFGPPGCGKGTQSAKLTKKYNLVHLSTGDEIRNEIKTKTEFGKKLASIVEKGELVPYEMIIKILECAMARNHDASGFIFDGFPRTIEQAEDLDKILAKENNEISAVFSLCIEDDIVVERLLNRAKIEGRKDDNEEVIKNRLKVYKEQTYPLIDFYMEQGKYVEVDGDCAIDDIFCHISKVIDKKLQPA